MAIPMLNWSSLTDSRDPKFMVKGTRIAQAIYGFRSRYAIVELRTRDTEGHASTTYAIADAEAAGDAHYAAGGTTPLLPGRYDDLAEPIRLIDEWSQRRQAEHEAFMADTD